MAKAEKFHEMVGRVMNTSPAHAQAIAAFTKRNGPQSEIAALNRRNGNKSVASPKPGAKVKPPLLQGAMNP